MNTGEGVGMGMYCRINGYFLTILFAFGPAHAGESHLVENSVPVQIELQDVMDRSIRGLPSGFPALSENGDELAVFHSSNTHVDEAVLYIVRVADKILIDQFVFISELAGIARGHDAAFEHRLDRVLDEANEYLANGNFAAIPLLYEIPSLEAVASTDSELWTTTSDGHDIQFNVSSGEIVISRQGETNLTWRMRRPLEVWGPQDGHPFNFCQAQGTPYRGWLANSEGVLLINIGFLAGTDQCSRSDEWVIHQFPEIAQFHVLEMGGPKEIEQ